MTRPDSIALVPPISDRVFCYRLTSRGLITQHPHERMADAISTHLLKPSRPRLHYLPVSVSSMSCSDA